jgi:hypothetical protein
MPKVRVLETRGQQNVRVVRLFVGGFNWLDLHLSLTAVRDSTDGLIVMAENVEDRLDEPLTRVGTPNYPGHFGNANGAKVVVPRAARAAFDAGGDWRPLLDWLAENDTPAGVAVWVLDLEVLETRYWDFDVASRLEGGSYLESPTKAWREPTPPARQDPVPPRYGPPITARPPVFEDDD